MNKIFKVAIVGGGASGLLCATELLQNDNALFGEQIIILERNERVGKKLIATGNGQGNLFNACVNLDNYHGEKGFIRAFFSAFNQINLASYLEQLGIYTCEEEDGKIYPLSMQANSVLDNIRLFLDSKNCQVKTSFYVDNIQKKGDVFIISSGKQEILAENVVCAFGGMAGKQYGTDGSSYKLLEKFGHKVTKLTPSLVQLKVDLQDFKGLKGIKEKVRITGLDNDKVLMQTYGDLLFTEYGLSGSAIFKISSVLQSAKEPIISLEFLPSLSKEKLLNIIRERKKLSYIPKEDLLLGVVNKQLGRVICKKYSKENDVVQALKNLRFRIKGDLGFNYAQVTKGGINTNDVNPFSFQSKLLKNLYLTGELLDVDGDCGGYNLAFCFVSGITVAKDIKKIYSGVDNGKIN